MSASAIVPRNWPIVRLRDSTLWLLAHRYERVPASTFLYMTLSPWARRRAFRRSYVINAPRDRAMPATALPLSLPLSLRLSVSLPLIPRPRDNYCELLRKKESWRPLRFLRAFPAASSWLVSSPRGFSTVAFERIANSRLILNPYEVSIRFNDMAIVSYQLRTLKLFSYYRFFGRFSCSTGD